MRQSFGNIKNRTLWFLKQFYHSDGSGVYSCFEIQNHCIGLRGYSWSSSTADTPLTLPGPFTSRCVNGRTLSQQRDFGFPGCGLRPKSWVRALSVALSFPVISLGNGAAPGTRPGPPQYALLWAVLFRGRSGPGRKAVFSSCSSS